MEPTREVNLSAYIIPQEIPQLSGNIIFIKNSKKKNTKKEHIPLYGQMDRAKKEILFSFLDDSGFIWGIAETELLSVLHILFIFLIVNFPHEGKM